VEEVDWVAAGGASAAAIAGTALARGGSVETGVLTVGTAAANA
jgi:hypothetical protein